MIELQQDPEVLKIAEKLGCKLDSTVTFDAQTPLRKVAAQIHGEAVTFGAEDAEFGGFFSKLVRKTVPGAKKVQTSVSAKLAAQATTPAGRAMAQRLAKAPLKLDVKRTATGLVKGVTKGAAVLTFVVPGVGPIAGGAALSAMASADKLLGDPKIKDAAKVISNTKALAALGNVPARRGAAVLGAVAQLRQQKGTPIGKKAVPAKAPAVGYAQKVPAAKVQAAAAKKVAEAPRRSFWQKLKDLFK